MADKKKSSAAVTQAQEKKRRDGRPHHSLWRILRNNGIMLGKIWKFTPEYMIGTVIEGVIWGFLNSAEVLFINRLFNAMDDGSGFWFAAKIIGILLVFYFGGYIFDGIYWQCFAPVMKQKLSYRMQSELFRIAEKADLACYDDPKYYNDFVWAMDEAASRAVSVQDNLGKIINRVVASGATFTVLFTIDRVAAIVILAQVILRIILNQITGKLNYKYNEETKPISRRKSYVNRVYHLGDYSKELRCGKVWQNIDNICDQSYEDDIEICKRYNRKYFLLNTLMYSTIGNIAYYGITAYMTLMLTAGKVLVGGFAAAVNSIWRVRWIMTDLTDRLTKFYEYSLFIEKYVSFLANEPKIVSGDKSPGQFESLKLEDLSFTYEYGEDGADKDKKDDPTEGKADKEKKREALCGVELEIKKGERIALVGYNGAGKTTLTKLIMRLYDPTGGRVLYNGVDIKEYRLDEYRGHIAALFQDFRIFAATVAENVLCRDFREEDREKVEGALRAATFGDKLDGLKDGIMTPLTREFDKNGTNLSGGEAQKVAIARVFASDAELIIMDEPSAALDPAAEYELNHAILRYAGEKTVIFISHRLSTTRMADRIYMFDGGRIAESGTHDELMQQNGKYAAMFRLQAKKYTDNLGEQSA